MTPSMAQAAQIRYGSVMINSIASRALSHSALVLLLLATCAAQAAPPSAEAFLRGLYAHYAKGAVQLVAARDPWQHPALAFTPATAAVIERDRRMLTEVGVLDGDPICGCQDWSGLVVDKIVLHAAAKGGTDAVVTFHDGKERREVSYHLVLVKGRWAIADMSLFGADSPKWLVATLTDEMADLARHK
jgi:hypothetical protein